MSIDGEEEERKLLNSLEKPLYFGLKDVFE